MSTVRATRTPPRYRETPEIAAAARRMVRAVARRAVQDSDIDALSELVTIRSSLDEAIVEAVAGLRSGKHPYSWADVARVTGMTRSAAQERFHPREPGQPKRARPERTRQAVPITPLRRKSG